MTPDLHRLISAGEAPSPSVPDSLAVRYGVEPDAIFDGKDADYERARPGYPSTLLDALPPARDVADLGAGSGLLTAALLSRGARVTAVEPNDGMRAACDRKLGRQPGYASQAGSAEASGLEAASIDLLTAAQSFHWFDIAAARLEALRVLRPAGQVALIWNDRADDALNHELDAVFAKFGGARRAAMVSRGDRAGVPEFFGAAGFSEQAFPHFQNLDLAGLEALAFSRSYMPTRDGAEGCLAAAALAEVFGRFATQGHVTIGYDAVLIVGRPAG